MPTTFLQHDSLALQLGVLSALAAYVFHSLVDFNLHIPGNALLIAGLFGVLVRPASLSGPAGPKSFSPFRLILPAMGIWMCAEGLPRLPAEYRTEQLRKALLLKRYDRVLALGKSMPEPVRNYEVYFYQGEANRAMASASTLRALRPPFFTAAIADFDRALALFPRDSVAWLRLGQALDGLRLFPQAQEAYTTALRLDPQQGNLHAWYAAHLRLRGLEEDARKELKTAETLAGHRLDDLAADSLDAPPPIGTRP